MTPTKLRFSAARLRSSEHSFGSETGEQTKTVRPQNEVKQGRFTIGPLEEGAAELGAGAPESEVLIEVEEESEEARPLKRMNDSKDTSAKERRSHALTHLPYCTWCARCGSGTGTAAGHSFFFLLRNAEIQGSLCTAASLAHGSATQFPKKRMLAFLRELGAEFCTVFLKSDGEPAIKAFEDEIAMGRGEVQTIKEDSPTVSSGSNGVVERAIQNVQGILRVTKCALGARWRKEILDEHPALVWMAAYAAVLLNRCEMARTAVRPTSVPRARWPS